MPSGIKLLEGYVEVTADGKPAAEQVARDIEGASEPADRAGKSFGKKLVGGIVGSFAALKVGQFIGDSITAASDLNETVNKSATIFGTQAAAIDTWASNAATNLGLSKAAALDAAAGFGNMFTQLGFTSDQAAALSQTVVQTAADLGSFNNVPTADVADRISAAFRGEYDSLQALIPNINAARVEQEAMAATGKTNAAELTAQEKAAAVLAIVNRDGAAAMGDFAKTADSTANQQKTAAAQTEDLKAALGNGLLPVVNTILGVVTSQFLPMLQDFANWISQNESVIMPLVIILGVLAAAIWVVNVAMYANPVGLIIAGIVLLIGIIVLLVTQWDTVVAFLTTVWQGFVDWIVGVINGFVGWWNSLWAGFGAWITSVWQGFVSWIQGLWQGFINFIIAVLVGYVSFWMGVWNGIASFFTGVWNGIVSFASGAINNLVGFFTSLPGRIMGAISGAATWLVNVGQDIIGGLWAGIESAWGNLVDWFSGLFGDLIGIAKRILGIASPSKVFRHEIGAMLPAGAELGIRDGMPSLRRTVATMIPTPSSLRPAGAGAGGAVVHLSQAIYSTDPILGARQAAREVNRTIGV